MSTAVQSRSRRTSSPDASLRASTIAFLLRRENPVTATQRIVLLERALAPRYLGWLAHENAAGANIYVAANPLRSGSRKRTKESIASVRHLYIDIDTDGEARLAALRASDAVPTPTAILSTSPGKYQVLWRVEGFDFERRKARSETARFRLRRRSRLHRLQPCSPRAWVPESASMIPRTSSPSNIPSDCDTANPDDFRLDISASRSRCFPPRQIPPRKHPGKHTNSEHDWAWVLHELAGGKDAVKLTRELASRRSDKPNPLYYAQRTVDVASARLWLIEGIRIDDVITMLEVRRRFEIPDRALLRSCAGDCRSRRSA